MENSVFKEEQWITNGKIKIKNPIIHKKGTNIHSYEGEINGYIFGRQQQNYDKISQQLNKNNIFLTKINAVVWTPNKNKNCSQYNQLKNEQSTSKRTKFIVSSSDPNFLWHKYDGDSAGSGHNVIYYKEKKINTTDFIKMTDDDLKKFLEII